MAMAKKILGVGKLGVLAVAEGSLGTRERYVKKMRTLTSPHTSNVVRFRQLDPKAHHYIERWCTGAHSEVKVSLHLLV